MARSFNQVILVGNLTRDPEVRTIPSGQSVTSFGVATSRSWKSQDSDEWQEQTEFHNVTVWGRQGETAAQYLAKGRKVMIVGRLQTRSWEGEDGKKNYRTEIIAEQVNFLDGRGQSPGDDSGFSQDVPTSDTNSGTKAKKTAKKDEKIEIEDLGDDVDLSEIPF
jgi:single-strand DNA-binding protein